MLIDGGKLFVVAERDVYCIDPSGTLLWQKAHGIPSLHGSPSVGFPGNVRQGDTMGWK
jgi:outer membrane protein assembly factor BamB